MNQNELIQILNDFKNGDKSEKQILELIKDLPFENLGHSKIDHHRQIRSSFPEVILAEFKSIKQIIEISQAIVSSKSPLFVTRLKKKQAKALKKELPKGKYNSLAKTFFYFPGQKHKPKGRDKIIILTAGTSDLQVAQEAKQTALAFGVPAKIISDVGVAGVHRLLHYRQKLEEAAVLIVVAGMDGALPSVVGGLVSKPIIAVPTSVGYGSSFDGLAALLTMLNSCASGVTVVNIDNGFGAAFSAVLMVNQLQKIRDNIINT
jgi:hypothetical protein